MEKEEKNEAPMPAVLTKDRRSKRDEENAGGYVKCAMEDKVEKGAPI